MQVERNSIKPINIRFQGLIEGERYRSTRQLIKSKNDANLKKKTQIVSSTILTSVKFERNSSSSKPKADTEPGDRCVNLKPTWLGSVD